MFSDRWEIEKVHVPAAHTRGLERGARHEAAQLQMVVNHYRPKSNPEPRVGDPTFIMVQGIGSAKECYEPLFDDLLAAGVSIRGVWIPDAVYNGESYLLNEGVLGDQIHWNDFPRDISQMINHLQNRLPTPLIAVGQSLGAGQVVMLSTWHPRLFAGLIFLEPALGSRRGVEWPVPFQYSPGYLSATQQDWWSSRAEAARQMRQKLYYKPFDPRVFDRVVKHELRDVGDGTGAVTLTTPKHVIVAQWFLPDPPLSGHRKAPEQVNEYGDMGGYPGLNHIEASTWYNSLPALYPPVFIVWGSKSVVARADNRQYYLDNIGQGFGGSGGVKAGKVQEAFIPGGHHPVSLEKPAQCAAVMAEWLTALKKELDVEREERKHAPPFVHRVPDELMERLSKL